MASSNDPAPSRQSLSGRVYSRIELRELSPAGMVIHCGESMCPGTSLALGVQLPLPSNRRKYLGLEGLVVDCRRITPAGGMPCWEVVLLFQDLTSSQTRALRAASRSLRPAAGVPAPAAREWDVSRWCGNN